MSRLYPARVIPYWMMILGAAALVFSAALGVRHFIFGLPTTERGSGEALSDTAVVLLTLFLLGIGTTLILLGRAILSAATRHGLREAGKIDSIPW